MIYTINVQRWIQGGQLGGHRSQNCRKGVNSARFWQILEGTVPPRSPSGSATDVECEDSIIGPTLLLSNKTLFIYSTAMQSVSNTLIIVPQVEFKLL